jgi:hypothetical protein
MQEESILPFVKHICLDELHWSDDKWQQELNDYQTLWVNCYSLPSREIIPDWKALVSQAKTNRKILYPKRRRKIVRRSSLVALILLLCASIFALFWKYLRRST